MNKATGHCQKGICQDMLQQRCFTALSQIIDKNMSFFIKRLAAKVGERIRFKL